MHLEYCRAVPGFETMVSSDQRLVTATSAQNKSHMGVQQGCLKSRSFKIMK